MQSQQIPSSGLILPSENNEFLEMDNFRETEAPPFYPPDSLFAGHLLDDDDGSRSAVELSDSCSSWLSFLHADILDGTESSVNVQVPQPGPESSTTAQTAAKRTPRTRLSASAVKILRAWFEQHSDDPYPSDLEKEDLARRSGLSLTQVSNWFNNSRRSKGKTSRARQRAPGSVNHASFLSPLERWQHSPPETEAAATSDIIRALEAHASASSLSYHGAPRPPNPFTDPYSSNSSSASLFIPGALSADIFEHSQSSGSELDFKSHVQAQLQRPPTPVPSRRRRNRVRPFKKPKGQEQGARPYQCTFCADSFLTKYDWQRHEKALHLPVDQWVCAPRGSVLEVDNNTRVCVFCHALDPTPEHLARHNFLTCQSKSLQERLFFRKDHLKQHLKLTHNATWLPSMEAWLETRNAIVSRCGFCSATFSAWDERVEHIAEHFKAGATMAQWKGDWGFEPDIEKEVQNAMAPYLLGNEQKSINPWRVPDSTSTTAAEGGFAHLGNHESLPLDDKRNPLNALSYYTSLRRELVAYIRTQLAANVYPSDLDLQDMARLIAYGDTDRWNQTYADDPAWLGKLKEEAGLGIHGQSDTPQQKPAS
ncbi:hypothetical protein BJY00DRAFT_110309 [Aspergillus carlsbadensis]|nr:hypothetical protein BJY00DRAFT_110309 [Aspergillus carlsbadensis]